MNYLLDTHILLWSRLDLAKIKTKHRDIIESTDEEKFISAISIWEISLKYSLGKLDLGGHNPEEFIAGLHKFGIKVISPTPEQYSTFHLLPNIPNHKDPFDRMIVWHALHSGMTLLSSDNKLAEYELHGLSII
jgi:PIN domain nuclease of toxin-antitoxin system